MTLTRNYRSSTALTPLASAFNSVRSNPMKMSLPSMSPASTGLFKLPQLTSASGFGEMQADCFQRSSDLVREACSPDRTRLVTRIFDDLSDELCRVADLAEFVRLAHPDREFAQAAEDACISISGLVENLNTHLGLYNSLRKVVESETGDLFPEDEVDRHVGKLFLIDFQQCGIHLDDESRKMVVKLNDHVLQLGQRFAAGAHEPKAVNKNVLPENMRHFFAPDGETIVLNGKEGTETLWSHSVNVLFSRLAHR